ncbi:MAG: hypothetical protein ACPGJS_06465 [Flammeovirgaceae bacterium]
MKRVSLIIVIILFQFSTFAQRFPSEEENISYLVTFGKNSDPSWGDDDFNQIFFFSIPNTYTQRFYIRVFDPDTGGAIDEGKGEFDTKVRFSVYGGIGVHSDEAAQGVDPVGNYQSGTLLATKSFGKDSDYDQSWYTFGPFNPKEGELDQFDGYTVFKIIADGLSGDDGNLYYYTLSSSPEYNQPIDGANGFTYEYSFRLQAEAGTSIMHVYPYVTDNVIAIQQHNFDFDSDGQILLYSISKFRNSGTISGDNHWSSSKHPITLEEKNSSIDIQIVKRKAFNNNIVFYVTNQYNKALPFFSVPIGGPPKFKFSPKIRKKSGN